MEAKLELSQMLFGEYSQAFCSDLIGYAAALRYNSRRYNGIVDRVEAILGRGKVRLREEDGVNLETLKKWLGKEETKKE